MCPGSDIVDLAAEQGGNCALTEPGQEVVRSDVVVLGLLNLPSLMPYHASQLYAQTVVNYLLYLLREGTMNLDRSDELVLGPLVTHAGKVVFPHK
jgi:NAD(P) transhydrogenase subunit alpha